MIFKKRGQVWVETAIYTLIGLTIISIVLSFAMPQIDKVKDRAIISQTIDAMNIIDNKILEVEQAQGSIGVISLKISKGKLDINNDADELLYTLEDTRLQLSEIGEEIKEGNLIVKTETYGKKYKITIKRIYLGVDITYHGGVTGINTIHAAGTPYQIYIENKGDPTSIGKIQLDFKI